MNIDERIAALRKLMKENGIDAYIVGSPDTHQSEYVTAHWRCREFISGFTGSAGTFVTTLTESYLWADGRYYIQADQQTEGSCIKVMRQGLEGVPSVAEWLAQNLNNDSTVGFDGRCVSMSMLKIYEKEFKPKKIKTNGDYDFIARIWDDRPTMPSDKIFEHDVKFAGKSRLEKLAEVRSQMVKKGADAYLVSSLDDIAWLTNARGNDVEHTPVFYAYAYIDKTRCIIFVNPDKLEPALAASFENDGITVKPYDDIFTFLRAVSDISSLFVNPARISAYLKGCVGTEIELVEDIDITTRLKAIKNDTEIKCIEQSQVKDGVATFRFMKWVKEGVLQPGFDYEEADLHDKLHEFRSGMENYKGPSFWTIAAYMANAALMHYRPEKGKSAKIVPNGTLLIDTGGQYLDGTTDITRTFALGTISNELKTDFTIVLKSHVQLALAKFLYGAHGASLDILARRPMWDRGLDYKCGSGHGVGFFLSVHEGPQSFGMAVAPVKFEKGMIVTNEPGIYKAGEWGIRTENTVLVTEDYKNENGTFMKFETISYCPIDLDAIDASLLSDEEKEWLNLYHAMVFSKLSPHLTEEEKDYLRKYTKSI